MGTQYTLRRRQWHPTPVLLPGKSHGRRSLVGCSSWGRYESDTTEWLHFHLSLSCIGEGNGNPCQCSCLENPRDGGAWRAAIDGVAHDWSDLAAAIHFANSHSSEHLFWIRNKLFVKHTHTRTHNYAVFKFIEDIGIQVKKVKWSEVT